MARRMRQSKTVHLIAARKQRERKGKGLGNLRLFLRAHPK
jgi:hypothetical protein